jgi:hypothetical protein
MTLLVEFLITKSTVVSARFPTIVTLVFTVSIDIPRPALAASLIVKVANSFFTEEDEQETNRDTLAAKMTDTQTDTDKENNFITIVI